MSASEPSTYRVDWQEARRDWPAWLALLASFVASLMLYPHLPEQVPIHWNLHGEADGFAGKFWGAIGLPLLNVGIYLMLLFLPLVDPKRANYPRFIRFYRGFRVFMAFFFAGLHGVTLYAALGRPIDVGLVVTLGVSLLFVYLGNSLGRIRHNYFVGIRTPWTLANEEVWRRTHRLGGRLFVLAGLLPWLAWPFSRAAALYALIGGSLVVALVTTVYSAVLFQRINAR